MSHNHPFGAQASASSREKFKSMTGVRGGGHDYGGSSHMKKPGKDGVHKKFSGHAGHYLEGKTAGSPSKPRADKFARGGAVALARGGHAKKGKGKGPENVTINIQSPPPSGAETGKLPPMPPPGAAPPGGGAGPPPPPPAPPGGGGANPMMQGIGKGMGFARGGRAKGGHRDSADHKLTGDSKYDLSHWRGYANRDRQKLAGKRVEGDGKRPGHVPARTKPIGKVEELARGGSAKGSWGIPPTSHGLPTAGASSGVGRIQKTKVY